MIWDGAEWSLEGVGSYHEAIEAQDQALSIYPKDKESLHPLGGSMPAIVRAQWA